MSPEVAAVRTMWINASFKIPGHAVIMQLDTTIRVFTDLALKT